MAETIVTVENLSKRYLVVHQSVRRQNDTTFRDLITRETRNFARKAVDIVRRRQVIQGDEIEAFWALKDVSFDIKQGEVLGIIGRNGAGKSTLLKVLSRITEPTKGRVLLRGRVASLLEVGTGFHPELTGRENIFLNGAILGMTQREIRQKFDEIVAFAEVEKFLDMPVKRYSSGMYVRLAFAVAAHLEPEILIVDEVLAVGDLIFQKKCLAKMSDVASKQNRTVIFVSHNMTLIQAICDRVLLLDSGTIRADGRPDAVTTTYLVSSSSSPSPSADGTVLLEQHHMRHKYRCAALRRVWLEDCEGVITTTFLMGTPFRVVVQFSGDDDVSNPGYGFGIEDEHGRRIFSFNNYMDRNTITLARARKGTATLIVDRLPLLPGTYYISLSIVESEREWVDRVDRAIQFTVEPSNVYGTGRIPERSQGVIFVDAQVVVSIESSSVDNELTPSGIGGRCGDN
jgi:lipopolysaccharide transport system ATP-binding protein